MDKFLTGLVVWTVFLMLMGIFFPVPLTHEAGPVVQVLQSYTIYGFFSLVPIVVYGSIISFISDWLAKRCQWHVQVLAFVFHIFGAMIVYFVTSNISITILAVVAAILFFIADRFFALMRYSTQNVYLARNLPIVMGFVGVTVMVLGSVM